MLYLVYATCDAVHYGPYVHFGLIFLKDIVPEVFAQVQLCKPKKRLSVGNQAKLEQPFFNMLTETCRV